MKYKRLVTVVTVAVFILLAIVAVFWLFRVREVKVRYVSYGENGTEKYLELDEITENTAIGKSILFINTDKLKEELETSDPYIFVEKIEKAYPDRIIVDAVKREEKFSLLLNGEYYLFSSGNIYLRKTDIISDDVLKISFLSGSENAVGFHPGKTAEFLNGKLISYAIEINSNADIEGDLIEEVLLSAERNRVYFKMATGVFVEFRFLPVNEDEEKNTALVGKAEVVFGEYLSLDEKSKLGGYLICYFTDDGKFVTEYTETEF
ncbi:MAG: hypothetical protein J6N93_05015 [Clostridia bacterium]|nr:hypothetical protein [Clostridia bacterium]